MGEKDFSEKEKMGRGQSGGLGDKIKSGFAVVLGQGWMPRLLFAVLTIFAMAILLFTLTRK